MAENELVSFPHLEKVLEEYGVEVRNTYQDKLIRDGKIATGDLLNKVDFKIKHDGAVYEVGLNLADYWKYVEYGRKPGGKFPPPDVIRQWIQVKPVLPRPMENGKLPTLNQLTFLISRSIAEKGIKPTNALGNTTKELNEVYFVKITQAFVADLQGRLRTMLRILAANG